MATAFDVARYILEQRGAMPAMKVQKLVYYAQAWALVWDGGPLFAEPIEAWANGPVCRELYEAHKGRVTLSPMDFAECPRERLSEGQRVAIDAVLAVYGDKSAQWLSEQTLGETPWQHARARLMRREGLSGEISVKAMADYYASTLKQIEAAEPTRETDFVGLYAY
ncbi:DUF4065 domain-containing protein [Aquabacterium sp. A7-Y]|uniref:Panacea domain-containing protein n=1 Tax=Aquabacterium sp. A7-Y TaxID=1349605 RepID=UPI00223D7978|nr:type II toxin-antitoxin system antitoxin SocA domain-containing protein [Aquabacterium sp. A7-Y]MCW7540494.1 DUF4065 domain-containing protein [Aquabacterium sp. A7-Y]